MGTCHRVAHAQFLAAPAEDANGKEIGALEIEVVIDIMQESFRTALFLATPALLSALLVGVAVSVFQSVTSIQEQTLVFVPKMLAVMVALILTFSWMLSMILRFTEHLYGGIPALLE